MKIIRLILAFLYLGICAFALSQEPAPGWKPGMTKAEYELWKQQNIARMRAEQISKGDLGLVENLRNGVHYFPFSGKRFVEVLAKFADTQSEYEIVSTAPVTDARSARVNIQNESFDLRHEAIIGYVVVIKLKPPLTRTENSPEK